MRFHSWGLGAWSSSGLGFFKGWVEGVGWNVPSRLEGIILIVFRAETVPTLLPSPSYQSQLLSPRSHLVSEHPLSDPSSVSLHPALANLLLVLPILVSSAHLQTIHLIMQKHTCTQTAPHPRSPDPQIHLHISIISAGLDCLAVSRKGETEICGEGGKITGEWKTCIPRRNTLWQLLVFGITALMVLHAREVPSIY